MISTWLGNCEHHTDSSLEMLSQYWDELEICEKMCRGRVFCFSSLIHPNHVWDAYSKLHKEFEVLKPLVQLLTPQWQTFRQTSKILKLSLVTTRDGSICRKGQRSSWKCFGFFGVSRWGILLPVVSFFCNRKTMVSAAWEKEPSHLLSDETLWTKFRGWEDCQRSPSPASSGGIKVLGDNAQGESRSC